MLGIAHQNPPTPKNPNIMHSQTIKATLTATGQIIPQEPLNLPPGEIEILILTPSQNHPPESLRQQAIHNGYDTREKILDLIQKVKHEIIVDKGWVEE